MPITRTYGFIFHFVDYYYYFLGGSGVKHTELTQIRSINKNTRQKSHHIIIITYRYNIKRKNRINCLHDYYTAYEQLILAVLFPPFSIHK